MGKDLKAQMNLVDIKRPVLIILLSTFFLLSPLGCSKKGEGDKPVPKDEEVKPPVVAKVGNDAITVSDFKNYLSGRPTSSRSQISKEDVGKRLDEMILEEVLYQEALRTKLDREPEVRNRIRRMLTQKLLDEKLKREVWEREITENELREYYDQNRNEFNRPEQVRLADIFVAVPADTTDEKKDGLIKKAETALAEALAVRKKRTGFGTLVSKYSDTHEKYRKGDSGFFDSEGKPVGIDKKLAEAAFRLKRVGSMAEHLIETPEGYHVIMLVGKRSSVNRPLNGVKNQLKQRMRRETAMKVREAYIEGLKEKAEIHIDPKVMSGILEELNSKARTSQPLSGKKKMSSRRGSGDSPPSFPGGK